MYADHQIDVKKQQIAAVLRRFFLKSRALSAVEAAATGLDEVIFLFALKVVDTAILRGGEAKFSADVRGLCVADGADAYGDAVTKCVRAHEDLLEGALEFLEDAEDELGPAEGERLGDPREIEVFGDDDAELPRPRIEDLDARTTAVFPAVETVDAV